MSVNYTHKVDVPVTDLDDDADDVLFRQHVGGLDAMDFGEPEPPSRWHRWTAMFRRYEPLQSYELARFDVDEDEDVPPPPPKRRWKNAVLAVLAVAVLGLIAANFTPHVATAGYVAAKTRVSNGTAEFHPTTVIVSLDGFHPHYISPKVTPTLHEMMLGGYGAPYMVPSFPSSTFPNHWTLVTGLYPSEHGIVGNTFFDPQLGRQFVNTDPSKGGLDPDFWRGGEPIWTTARRQGVNAAVHMWPGSEVPGVGVGTGVEVDRYNGSEVLSAKVARVMGWLDRELASRPELVLTYVPTIDSFGHKFGISGPELKQALTYVDDFVALMRSQLAARNLTDIVNLVIVSDHGMASTANDRLLYLDDLVDMRKIEHVDGWPLFGLRPFKQFSVDEIHTELVDKLRQLESASHFDVYRTEDLPAEWNFGGAAHHRFDYRLAALWIVPHVGYSVTTHDQMKENDGDYKPKGVHGYNNTELLMRAVFLGEGPYFRSQLGDAKRVRPFVNTNIYNVLCDTLGLSPAPNNGSMKDGYIQSVVGAHNLLPQDWTDPLVYPGLDYEVEHLVEDATYDMLFKPKDGTKPSTVVYGTNNHAAESLSSEEASMTKVTSVSLPKPSDFTVTRTATDSKPDKPDKPDSGLDKVFDGLHDIGDHIGDQIEDIEEDVGDLIEDVGDKVEHLLDKIFGDGH